MPKPSLLAEMTWTAFGQSLPQAIGIAISPIPIVLLILMLVSSRARTNGPMFAVGWLTGIFLVATVSYALSDSADVATDPTAADGGNAIQVVLGLLFLALAVRQWRQRPRPGVESRQPKIFSAVDTMGPAKVLGLGFVAAAANPKNLPLAISGGVTIAGVGATTSEGLLAVALFSLAASATVLIPVVAVLALGDRTRGPLDELRIWLLANNSTIMMVLFVILGAKMLGSGLALAS